VTGLFAAGVGLGSWSRVRDLEGGRGGTGGLAGAGVLLLVAALLAGLPGRGGAP
jgi:hypothetical protein